MDQKPLIVSLLIALALSWYAIFNLKAAMNEVANACSPVVHAPTAPYRRAP